MKTAQSVSCVLGEARGPECAAVIVHRTEQPSIEIFSIQNIKDKTNYGNKYRKESIRRFCNVSLNVCARLQLRHRCDQSIQQALNLGNYAS